MAKINLYRVLHKLPLGLGAKLRARRWLLDREFNKERKAVGEDGEVSDDWQLHFVEHEEDESAYHSRVMLGKAEALRLPRPAFMVEDKITEDWERSRFRSDRWHLSLIGERKLRAAIREEEKHRSDRWSRRIPYITALSGLIGTITGLIAVLLK